MNRKLSEMCESGIPMSTIDEEENKIKKKQETPFNGRKNSTEEKNNFSDEKNKKSNCKKCFTFERTGRCAYKDACRLNHPEKVCKIFTALSGECYKGDECSDRHPTKICHFWQSGDCGRGQNCVFQHFKEDFNTKPKARTPQNKSNPSPDNPNPQASFFPTQASAENHFLGQAQVQDQYSITPNQYQPAFLNQLNLPQTPSQLLSHQMLFNPTQQMVNQVQQGMLPQQLMMMNGSRHPSNQVLRQRTPAFQQRFL